MDFLDRFSLATSRFFSLAVVSLIFVTGIISWALSNMSEASAYVLVVLVFEALDVLWIFSLGLFLGWYLSPQKQPRRDKELRSDDGAPSRPLN
jgi:hypothetical protein